MGARDHPGGPPNSLTSSRRFARDAMATTFEIVIADCDAQYAEQAAWAAFEELDRLEMELSRFIEHSDISRINRLPTRQPVQVSLETFECLELSRRLHSETGGAFDITTSTPWHASLEAEATDRLLAAPEGSDERGGMRRLRLDAERHTVEVLETPLRVDLGGVGKGYAVDRMTDLLREWSIERALVHGGRSSVRALDTSSEAAGWPVRLTRPPPRQETLFALCLRDGALGGSGLQKGCHIMDPRTGRPVRDRKAAWSFAPTAAMADALSTAFMAMTPREIEGYCSRNPRVAAVIVPATGEPVVARGSGCPVELTQR